MLSKKPILTVNEVTPIGHHFIYKNKIFIISKKIIIIQIKNNMQVLWNSKVKFV